MTTSDDKPTFSISPELLQKLRDSGRIMIAVQHRDAINAGQVLADAGGKKLLAEPLRKQFGHALDEAMKSPPIKQLAAEIQASLPDIGESIGSAAFEGAREIAGEAVERGAVTTAGGTAARTASTSVAGAARVAARAVGRAGAIGAAIDGTVAIIEVVPKVSRGEVEADVAVMYVGREAAIGGVSAAAGVVATTAVVALGVSTGGVGLIAFGLAASFGARVGLDRAVPGVKLAPSKLK